MRHGKYTFVLMHGTLDKQTNSKQVTFTGIKCWICSVLGTGLIVTDRVRKVRTGNGSSAEDGLRRSRFRDGAAFLPAV
jgi:hypothetical protein